MGMAKRVETIKRYLKLQDMELCAQG
ncbi:hypothetical protein NPIL_598211, partial [Nephila pilipes]